MHQAPVAYGSTLDKHTAVAARLCRSQASLGIQPGLRLVRAGIKSLLLSQAAMTYGCIHIYKLQADL